MRHQRFRNYQALTAAPLQAISFVIIRSRSQLPVWNGHGFGIARDYPTVIASWFHTNDRIWISEPATAFIHEFSHSSIAVGPLLTAWSSLWKGSPKKILDRRRVRPRPPSTSVTNLNDGFMFLVAQKAEPFSRKLGRGVLVIFESTWQRSQAPTRVKSQSEQRCQLVESSNLDSLVQGLGHRKLCHEHLCNWGFVISVMFLERLNDDSHHPFLIPASYKFWLS